MENIENIKFSSDDFGHDYRDLPPHISQRLPTYNFYRVRFCHFRRFLYRDNIWSENRDFFYSKTTWIRLVLFWSFYPDSEPVLFQGLTYKFSTGDFTRKYSKIFTSQLHSDRAWMRKNLWIRLDVNVFLIYHSKLNKVEKMGFEHLPRGNIDGTLYRWQFYFLWNQDSTTVHFQGA